MTQPRSIGGSIDSPGIVGFDQRRGVIVRQVVALVDLSTIPTTSPVAKGTLRYFAMCMGDMRIGKAVASLEFATPPPATRSVRGRWFVYLVRRTPSGTYKQLTRKREVTNPGASTWDLGAPIARIRFGSPVFVQIDYEAPSAVAAEPVFWASSPHLNVTINME